MPKALARRAALLPLLAALPLAAPAAQDVSGFDHQHSLWTALLGDFVGADGRVDYRGLAQERKRLKAYLRSLEAVAPDEYRGWSATEKEAFWINAYNAYTVGLVLDHWPVDSIKDIGGLFSSVFKKRFVPLQHLARAEEDAEVHGKKELSLGELEHGVLGEIARQPLFHFAINCASASCPVLLDRAYVPETLDETLREQGRAFLADSGKNDQRIRKGKLAVSRIFDWSADELERYPGGIEGLLRDLGPPSVAEDAALEGVDLEYRDYDWSLNEWFPREAK